MSPPAVEKAMFQFQPVSAEKSCSSPKQLVDFYLPEETLEVDMDAAAVGDVGYGFFAVGSRSPSTGVRSGDSSRRSTLSATTEEEESDVENTLPKIRQGFPAPLSQQHIRQHQQHNNSSNHHHLHRGHHHVFYRHSGEEVTRGHIGVSASCFHRVRDAGHLAFASDLSSSRHQGIPIPKTQNLFSQDRELRKLSHTQKRPFSLGLVKRFHAGSAGPREADAEEKRSFRATTTGWRSSEDGAAYDSTDDDGERDGEERYHDANEGIFEMDF